MQTGSYLGDDDIIRFDEDIAFVFPDMKSRLESHERLNKRIYVAGHRGVVGNAIVRKLTRLGYAKILVRTHAELDLTDQVKVRSFFAKARPQEVKLCESYNRQYRNDHRSVMPTDLYGPGDNYHPENSHVLPALIRRFHEAKASGADHIVIWGSGNLECAEVADPASM